MKVGDTEPVAIKGDTVAEAKVVEIDRENNTVTLIVPATKVVMGLRLEIDTTPAQPDEGGTGHVLLGVEDTSGKTVDAVSTHVESTTPVGTDVTNVDGASIKGTESTGTATPVGEATQTAVEPPEKPVESQ